ncbi:MAG: thioredoxin [Clostridia bacterium]|nr:thioredoxin [Clostridia bacterium]
MAEIKVTSGNFQSEVMASDKPVLLDFWAEWCGPCRMLAPVIGEIARDYEGKVKVGKVNVDEESELAGKFGIASIPTLVLIKDGKIAATSVGFRPKAQIEAMLKI